MGVFDGFGPEGEDGSTAHLAKLLGIPAVLVVNAKGMARSIAAMAWGFQYYDPGLNWVGVIANKCGSPGHLGILRRAMAGPKSMPLLGGLAGDPELAMPERHLGLITAEEGGLSRETLGRLADLAEEGLDLEYLLKALPWVELEPLTGEDPVSPEVRIGVARDEAFCFYYQENLRRLRRAGAELVFFSPCAIAACHQTCMACTWAGATPSCLPLNWRTTPACAGTSPRPPATVCLFSANVEA